MSLFSIYTQLAYVGQALPYHTYTDDTLVIILLSCFFITCFSLTYSRKFLMQLGQNFIESKAHVSAFSTSTNLEVKSLFLLILQTCIMIAMTCLLYLYAHNYTVPTKQSSTQLIAFIAAGTLFILFFKWILYSYIGWIFKQKEGTAIWLESYATIIYYLGLIMYPIVLYIVFNNVSGLTLKFLLIGGFALTKGLILYKALKLFSNKIYGHVLLILYFCALEIVPYALLFKGMNKYIMF